MKEKWEKQGEGTSTRKGEEENTDEGEEGIKNTKVCETIIRKHTVLFLVKVKNIKKK